jgi:hypothetical protein
LSGFFWPCVSFWHWIAGASGEEAEDHAADFGLNLLGGQMGLEIEGTHEKQFPIVKTAVKAHDASLYGNGQPGLMDFMSAKKVLSINHRAYRDARRALGILAALEGNRQYHFGRGLVERNEAPPI